MFLCCHFLLLFALLDGFASGQERTVADGCPAALVSSEDPTYLQIWDDSLCVWFVTHNKREYSEAEVACKDRDGKLAMPKTPAYNAFLATELINTYDTTDPTWIGLHDQGSEGTFFWADDTPMDFNNFAGGNGPDNNWYRRWAEDCVTIDPADDGLWHDYQCSTGIMSTITGSEPSKKFICEFPLRPQADTETEDVVSSDVDGTETDDTPDVDGSTDDTERTEGSSTSQEEDECPPFNCDLDCGLEGYQLDDDNCQICECWD